MRLRFLAPLLVAVLCSAGAAQAPRARIVGKAVDRTGKPWAGARVVFVAAEDQAPDRFETTTDERGRFRAELLPRRLYTGWAEANAEREKRRYSELVLDVGAPGAPLVLRERDRVMDVQSISIRGIQAWQERGPFSLHAVDVIYSGPRPKGGLEHEIHGDVLTATLPHSPASAADVRLYDKDGRILLDEVVKRTAWRRTEVMNIGEPHRLEVTIKDRATGRPVAGARVLLTDDDGLVPLAKSGADGKAGFIAPARLLRDSFRQVCVAADGYEMGVCDTTNTTEQLVVGLERGLVARGRVLLAADRPGAGIVLSKDEYGTNWLESGTYRAPYPLRVTTDANGAFELRHLYRHQRYEELFPIRLSEAHLAALPPAVAEAILADVPILFRSKAISESTIALRDVDLSKYTPIRISVRRMSGQPVRGALFDLLRPGRNLAAPLLRSRTDRDGRVCVLLPNHATFLISASAGDATWTLRQIWLDTDKQHAEPVPIDVALPDSLTISGRVLDPNGNAIANQVVTYAVNADEFEKDGVCVVKLPPGGKSEQDPGVWVAPAPRDVVAMQQHRAISWAGEVRTDDKGRYRVHVPAYSGGYRITAKRSLLFFSQRASRLARIENGPLTDFDLQLSRG